MKSFITKSMIAAAALAVAAGSAAAQTLKADIPFTFRALGTAMQPGTYMLNIENQTGHAIIYLRNLDTRKGVILAQYTVADPSKAQKAAGVPKLSFECTGLDNCDLRELYQGGESGAYRFRAPKPHGEAARMTEITLTGVKSE